MKTLTVSILALLLLSACSALQNGNVRVTICECQSLGDDYFDLKMNASSEEEKKRLAREELSKNIACAKLEQELGENLESEISKCNY